MPAAPVTSGRIATFPVFENLTIDDETVAEIVASSTDGNTLVYTDGATERIGFVDISDPAHPAPAGTVAVDGEPTSVAVLGNYALAATNTSADFVNVSGTLHVINMTTQSIEHVIALDGQPDSIAVSPDGQYAAIIIENERDEDLGNGEPPQLPAGKLIIVDLVGAPAAWTTRDVDLTGLATLFPEDPEPEYVDINDNNLAVVTMQENNHLVLVDLASGTVTNHFSAGTVDLTDVDATEDDVISQTESLFAVPREPDAVTWMGNSMFATADEGDLYGGSRGFTIFDTTGAVLYGSGNFLEHLTARHGHYPEGRSENKGCEPEGVEFGIYGGVPYLFVGSERSSVVAVYQLAAFDGQSVQLTYSQLLPTTLGPEGLHAIPSRDLFVVACEEDARDDKFRASVTIYQRGLEANYPSVVSADDTNGAGVPIGWAALSGLVTDPNTPGGAFTIHDSFYAKSRYYRMDLASTPAVITDAIVLTDDNNVLGDALTTLVGALPDPGDLDPADVINGDGTINVDPEGITAMSNGSVWIASEGSGNLEGGVSDPKNRPFTTPNLLIKASSTGVIEDVAMPPLELTQNQLRFGFEGVAVDESAGVLYVAFQRAWQASGDPSDRARIGRYEPATGTWTFAYYPLDMPESAAGGWVGLSEITRLDDGRLVVLERDNQGNVDAAVKRIYVIDPSSVTWMTNSATPADDFEVFTKDLARDLLLANDFGPTGGFVTEKLEGLAVDGDGTVWVVNDNDGVDDNSGETQLLRFDGLFAPCAGDVSGDGVVGFDDLLSVLTWWGACEGCPGDLDGNGVVDWSDILIVFTSWGPCPA